MSVVEWIPPNLSLLRQKSWGAEWDADGILLSIKDTYKDSDVFFSSDKLTLTAESWYPDSSEDDDLDCFYSLEAQIGPFFGNTFSIGEEYHRTCNTLQTIISTAVKTTTIIGNTGIHEGKEIHLIGHGKVDSKNTWYEDCSLSKKGKRDSWAYSQTIKDSGGGPQITIGLSLSDVVVLYRELGILGDEHAKEAYSTVENMGDEVPDEAKACIILYSSVLQAERRFAMRSDGDEDYMKAYFDIKPRNDLVMIYKSLDSTSRKYVNEWCEGQRLDRECGRLIIGLYESWQIVSPDGVKNPNVISLNDYQLEELTEEGYTLIGPFFTYNNGRNVDYIKNTLIELNPHMNFGEWVFNGVVHLELRALPDLTDLLLPGNTFFKRDGGITIQKFCSMLPALLDRLNSFFPQQKRVRSGSIEEKVLKKKRQ